MIPLMLFQVIAQALLLWAFYWAATVASPDTQGYVFYKDDCYEGVCTSFMVEVLLVYSLVVAAGAIALGFVEGALIPLRAVAACSALGYDRSVA